MSTRLNEGNLLMNMEADVHIHTFTRTHACAHTCTHTNSYLRILFMICCNCIIKLYGGRKDTVNPSKPKTVLHRRLLFVHGHCEYSHININNRAFVYSCLHTVLMSNSGLLT